MTIACTAGDAAIVVAVRDSGEGLSLDFLPFVFDRFRQADSRSTRKHGGLGLGLAIARHLVELHGGDIRAASAGPGCGTTVEVRLPVGSLGEQPVGRMSDGTRVPAVDEGLPLAGRRILVVDDHYDSREVLAAVFEARGAEVVSCASAAEALAHLASRSAHLVVADIAMPDVDGYELIRLVRERHGGVPALAVSAYARSADHHRALAAGYGACCAKPLTAAEIMRAVREVLADG